MGAYSISDALRRHYQSCSQLRGQLKPTLSKPGRPRKACDSCANSRIVCDGGTPCAMCQQSNNPCSYRRLETQRRVARQDGVDISTLPTTSQANQQETVDVRSGADKASLPFLLNYSATGDRHPGDVNHVLTQLATTEVHGKQPDTNLPSLHLDIEKAGLFAEDPWSLFFGTSQDTEMNENLPLPRGLEDREKRCVAAERVLQCILHTKSANPTVREASDVARAREFFQEENILNSIVGYFEHTVRPRCRIVLKSAFNLDAISPPLLLAMILMGASCGISEDMKSKAVEYVEIAEYAVFESQCFHDLVHGARRVESGLLSSQNIEIIQAAIIVILLQISSPNPTVRRRIRIQRYIALVSAARATGLTKVRNSWHDSNPPMSYHQFLRNEICIRLESLFAYHLHSALHD